MIKNTFLNKGNYSSRNNENSYFQDESGVASPCLTDRAQNFITDRKEPKEIQDCTKKIKSFIQSMLVKEFKDFSNLELFINELMKNLKIQSKFDFYTVNEDFLQSLFGLIKAILFRTPKYKGILICHLIRKLVFDTNLDTIPYANRDILDELILQEDSTAFKIRDMYFLRLFDLKYNNF